MKVKWTEDTARWFPRRFGEELEMGEIPHLRKTLLDCGLVESVEVEVGRVEKNWLKELRGRYPAVVRRLENWRCYEKFVDSEIRLKAKASSSLSLSGEIEKGQPALSLTVAKSFWPLKLALSLKSSFDSWVPQAYAQASLPLVNNKGSRPVISDILSAVLETNCVSSFWWTDTKQASQSKFSLRSNRFGKLTLVDLGARLQHEHEFPVKRWPLIGAVGSIKSKLGITLDAERPCDPTVSLVGSCRRSWESGNLWFAHTSLVGGVMHVIGKVNEGVTEPTIPLDEYLELGDGQRPVRGKVWDKKQVFASSSQGGITRGVVVNAMLGRRHVFHSAVGAFMYADGMATKSAAEEAWEPLISTGGGLGVQLTPSATMEVTVGVQLPTGSPCWDLRINKNF